MTKQLVSTMHHWSHAMKALVLASTLALAVPPLSAAAADLVPINLGISQFGDRCRFLHRRQARLFP